MTRRGGRIDKGVDPSREQSQGGDDMGEGGHPSVRDSDAIGKGGGGRRVRGGGGGRRVRGGEEGGVRGGGHRMLSKSH